MYIYSRKYINNQPQIWKYKFQMYYMYLSSESAIVLKSLKEYLNSRVQTHFSDVIYSIWEGNIDLILSWETQKTNDWKKCVALLSAHVQVAC